MRITITGAPAEGKTTVALLVAGALKDAGLLVEQLDVDIVEGPEIALRADIQEGRLRALRGRLGPIAVETQQVPKDGHEALMSTVGRAASLVADVEPVLRHLFISRHGDSPVEELTEEEAKLRSKEPRP